MIPRHRAARTLLVAAAASMLTLLPAAAETPRAMTAGEFTRAFAESLDPAGKSMETFDEARRFFASRGVALPAGLDPSAPLSEGMLAAIVNSAGMPAFSARPERLVEPAGVEILLAVLDDGADPLAGARSAAPGVDERADAPPGGFAASADRSKSAALGACCVAGACTQTGSSYCASVGGLFRGQGVPCTPDPCTSGVGTCCLGRLGPCTFTQPNECDGRFRGTQVCTRKTCSREVESPVQP